MHDASSYHTTIPAIVNTFFFFLKYRPVKLIVAILAQRDYNSTYLF